MLVVHPSVPVKTLRELIALAKARPGEINYAAGSIGATPHLAGEQFKVMAGVNVVRVPYKGTGPGMIGLMGGEVEFMFPGAASAWNYVKQKRLKALAVCSLKPSALFPGVVTMTDSGLPGYESVSPQGVVVPAKTPAAIVARLHQELVKALNRAETKQRLGELGIEVVANAPEEFAASMKNDTARTAKLIKDAGIRFE
jgi:tripartite-type tricarboxylate transporter receptor subunit TctC